MIWLSTSVVDLRHQPVGNEGEEFERFNSATSIRILAVVFRVRNLKW
jgi:hypothetical protein